MPLVELVAAIAVGRVIGAGWTVLALLALCLLGGAVVRRAGTSAFTELDGSLRQGRPPADAVADAAMLLVAGLLLLVPGFVTGVAGLLLLVPPLRRAARRPLESRLRKAAADRVTFVGGFGFPGMARGRGGAVITGEVIEEPPSSPPDPPRPLTP